MGASDTADPVVRNGASLPRLAIYQPSEVISDARYWTVFRSPESLRTLRDFYGAELRRLGWETTEHVFTATSATLVGRLGPHVTTISIRDIGSTASITIASY
ncbi:MAG: hypothetical protein JO372_09900 [Solirubrobacterales bacterium]|nr:hypothetical protein [Solirubrobacterales bacterium]